MKRTFSIKYFFIELAISLLIASLFSYFTQSFAFWFIAVLLCFLIFHHYNEFKLLKMLHPDATDTLKKHIFWIIFLKPLPTIKVKIEKKELKRYVYFRN